MGFRNWFEGSIFMRLILVTWIISSIFMIFLLVEVDSIVHGDLYNYGLQFSNSWAINYWAYYRLMYLCLAVPAVWSAVALVGSLLKGRETNGKPVPTRVEPKPVNGKVQTVKDNSMLISCPKCKRVFGKPLSMLDFSSGKTRLVNVCPYCNTVLGDADEESADHVHLEEPEKKTVY
jgi:uncharacterized Zn-finger protein